MGHVCFFFLTEVKIPDRVTTYSGGEYGACLSMGYACSFFLTESKIPDRVATCNSSGVHGVCLFIFPDRVATQLRWRVWGMPVYFS